MSVTTDPRRTYIAGADQYAYYVGDRALPRDVGDAVQLLGPGIFDRMMLDPGVFGVVDGLFIATLALPMTVAPAVEYDRSRATPEQIADLDEAERAADYVRASLESLDRRKGYGALERNYDLLRFVVYGHRLAEITTRDETEGVWSGYEVAASLTAKPRDNYAFVLDQSNVLKGVVAKIPGTSAFLRTGLIYDLSTAANAVDPDKLLVITTGGLEGDPRGLSWLEPCYAPYYDMQVIRVEDLRYIANHAGGKIWGTTSKNSATGTAPDGTPQTAEQAMVENLARFANDGVFAGQEGETVNVLFPSGTVSFSDYKMARVREIAVAIVKTARAQFEAEHGSKADTGEAQDVRGDVIGYLRHKLCDAYRECLRPMVRRNLGLRAATDLMPRFGMAAVSRPDLAATVTSFAAAGFKIFASQIPALCRLLGIPEPTQEELDAFAAQGLTQEPEGGVERKPGENGDETSD